MKKKNKEEEQIELLPKVNRIISAQNGDYAVDLFPYKIKNRELFYHREHPKNLNPKSTKFKQYWEKEFLTKCLEGIWVNDEGTWVFMMPKLFFYINYPTISDEKRDKIHPRLRDNEWIFFTYYLCSEGFSGFVGDEKYTCNYIVQKLEKGIKLEYFEEETLKNLPHLLKPDGTYKKYIDPWEYLTEVYLLTDKRDYPLGKALYDNNLQNIQLLCTRGVAKSYTFFVGYFLHEWLFNGARSLDERYKMNNASLFSLASPDKKALARSIANLGRAYSSMPGQYSFPNPKKKDEVIKYLGPYYKFTNGRWSVGDSTSSIEALLKMKSGKEMLKGSLTQLVPMKAGDFKIATGDRFRIIGVEESGFCKNLKEIYNASKDSLSVSGIPVGQLCMFGTGGDMELIQDSKDMFDNPEGYNLCSIPNYWMPNSIIEKRCTMFMGDYYKYEQYKDEQGNTKIQEAINYVVAKRSAEKAKMDSVSFGSLLMWNPIYPKELLRPKHKSPLPVVELSEHYEHIITHGIWDKIATVGSFEYKNGTTIFKPDLEKKLSPILSWGKDSELGSKVGAWVMYEDAPGFIPPELYYVLVDPIQQMGEGTSLQSILVYKRKFKNLDNSEDLSMNDTLVACYIGRYVGDGELEKNHEEVIKVARYYNAEVFSENNAMSFAEYVSRKNYEHYMKKTPLNVLKAIKGSTYKSHSSSYTKHGVKTNLPMNEWAINQLGNWLTTPIEHAKDGTPSKWVYNTIYDLRILSELINFNFDNKTEYDSVSALMLLPYLQSEFDDTVLEIENEEDEYAKYSKMKQITHDYSKAVERAAILNY